MGKINISDILESNITNKYHSIYPNVNHFIWEDPVYVWIFSVHIVIVFLGVVGNILSFVTLRSYRHHIGMELMLIYLAVVDLGTLLTTAGWVFCCMSPWARENMGVTGYIVFYLLYLHFQAMSIYAVIYLSLERHIAICKPLYAKQLCTPGKAKLAMLWITVGIVLYYLFKDIQYIYGAAHWGENHEYALAVKIFRLCFDQLLLYAIPLPLLFFLNLKLVCAIRQSQRTGLTRTVAQNSIGPTLNVAAVVGLFIITQTTNTVMYMYLYLYYGGFNIKDNLEYERILYSRNISISLNTSLNFVIYSVLSKQFRKALRYLFSSHQQPARDSRADTALTTFYQPISRRA